MKTFIMFRANGANIRNEANIRIMWKEIAIIFIVIFLIRLCIDVYIFLRYKQISNKFNSQNYTNLEKKTERLRKLTRIFSLGPWNKQMTLIYNNLCCIRSSIALVNDDEELFVNYLEFVKSEENYGLKPFMLALYYRSKKEDDTASKHYEQYMRSNHKDSNLNAIMNHLFCNSDKTEKIENLNEILGCFKNPAIIKLLNDNNLEKSK